MIACISNENVQIRIHKYTCWSTERRTRCGSRCARSGSPRPSNNLCVIIRLTIPNRQYPSNIKRYPKEPEKKERISPSLHSFIPKINSTTLSLRNLRFGEIDISKSRYFNSLIFIIYETFHFFQAPAKNNSLFSVLTRFQSAAVKFSYP